MAKKDEQFLVGDEVFHRATEEPIRGIIIKCGLCEIDFGPEYGTMVCDPATLSDAPIKRWKE